MVLGGCQTDWLLNGDQWYLSFLKWWRWQWCHWSRWLMKMMKQKPVTIKMKYGERKAKPGRSRREKDLQRSSLYTTYPSTWPSKIIVKELVLSPLPTWWSGWRAPTQGRSSLLPREQSVAGTNKKLIVARVQSLRMIIYKRPDSPDDHLQEARSSGWSFARGRPLCMMMCKSLAPPDDHGKRPDPPDDHLQKPGSSAWSIARGRILRMIICKKPDPPDDHLQEAGSSWWSFARGWILRMIICKRPDDYWQEAGS